ncbi:transcriptional regulator, LuxR family [Bacteroides eggerthii DSM 20697]|nr:transcriptional regulator, LuxR family [Bacteroides eggerthii DSM 20697]
MYICNGVSFFNAPMTIMREFIIADNQDITKAGMMFLLSRQKDTALLLEADNKAELIQQLRLHPGAVVILDYTSFDFVSSDELIVLHERFKEADWLLFSDELSIGFLRQVLFSSMSFGVVLKDNSKEEILTALQCASRKERFICNHVSNLLLSGNSQTSLLHPIQQNDLLTSAERSILKEIALGKTTKEIAVERNLSFHTINSHRKNIFRKLGVNNAHEATKYAMKAGIVDLVEYYI